MTWALSGLKQMIKGLHDNGISVVLDVVYNHVSDAEKFCFNQIVPGYFSRINADGVYSNGSYCGNDTASERAMGYKSSDAVNSIKWNNLNDPIYQDVADYYAGLIEFRKAHPALRMTSAEEVNAHITSLTKLEFNVVACQISAGANGEENEIIAIFNPRKEVSTVNLPEGEWTIYVDGENAGTTPLGTAQTEVKVEPISAMMLVKEAASEPTAEAPANPQPSGSAETAVPEVSDSQPSESGSDPLPALLGAMCAGLLTGVLVYKKKK